MGLDTYVKLGDFTFTGFEVPEEIPFGGEQRLVVHPLVGGGRVVDAMGREDAAISWRGMFLGAGALDRARKLDQMRVAGGLLSLTWSTFNRGVVIQRFTCSFQRFYKLPYEIECLVVQDRLMPLPITPAASFDSMVQGDMKSVNTLAGQVGDSKLSGLVSTLNSTIAAVSSFATAAKSTINGVLGPIAAARQQVNALIASTNNTLQNVLTVGGIFPGNPAAKSAAKLLNQASNMNNLPILRNMDGLLGRMGGNLRLINSGPNATTITQAGGNLFALAQKAYQDASKWSVLAQSNNLTDPVLTGVNTVTIPPDQPNASGGVLV
jgi:hypothetical protein